jgi:pimeloyl-ACP methyl ester carboxylesterase
LSVPRELSRRVVAGLVIVLVLIGAGYLGASYVMFDEFTRPEHHAVERAPRVQGAYEDITIRTSDGLALRGWFFPRSTDRAVVVVHGRNSNRLEWCSPDDAAAACRDERIASFLTDDGYSVVLFDLRGHGESEGTRFSLGYYERRDVAGAIGFLTARGFPRARIGVVGVSMGAASVLAALTLDDGIGPIVLDSSYADAEVELAEALPKDKGIPSFFAPGVLFAARMAFGIDTAAVRPTDIVRAHPERPFLFIHCDADELIAVHHARDLRAASANAGSELWIAAGCLHPRASDDHPQEYRRRVLAFLRAHLG